MALFEKTVSFVALISITLCSSHPYKRDFSKVSQGTGGGQGPFSSGSGGNVRFGSSLSNSGGYKMGINPFNSMANGASGGKGGSPFANVAGNGDGSASSGPFAGGMNNGGGGGSFGGSKGTNGGIGAGPFASGAAGNGASPFASTMSDGGGSGGRGVGPFAGATSGKESSPFNANMDNGGMPGTDFSSLLNSGPGGISGGDFLPKNISMLMGHDFSKDLGNNGQFGAMSSSSDGNSGVDNSRFDTTEYQQMLQQLFSTDYSGQGLKDIGTPFDGSAYNYNSNTGDHYNTAMEASVGSYASTGMSTFSGNSDATTGQANFQYHGIQKGNDGQYPTDGSSGYSGQSNMESTGSGSDGTYSSPFNVNNYNTGHTSSSTGGQNGMKNGQSPFNINNYSTGKTPFTIDSYSGDTGKGSGPFGMMSAGSNKNTGIGQNPFDTSKYQSSSAYGNMQGNQQYQNIGTGSVNYNSGLDEYGNVNFGTLSGLSGNQVDASAAGGLGLSSHSSRTNAVSAKPQGRNTYTGYLETVGTGQYGVNNGENYAGTGSESQYETPFEAENYNDLLGNPFKSDSYFDSTRQNFKLPYETDTNLQQTRYSSSGSSAGYGGGSYGTGSTGPGGDPFHQRGNSMRATDAMRG